MPDALATIGEAGLAIALAYAAATKFYDRERFVGVLRAGGLGRAAPVLGVAVPAVEVVVAGGLVVGTRTSQQVALVAAAGLMLAFSGWLLSLHRRRLRVPCRCFGSDADTRLGPALARNAGMAAVALACLTGDGGSLPVDPDGLAISVVAGSVVLLWATYGVVLAWPALLKRLPDEAVG